MGIKALFPVGFVTISASLQAQTAMPAAIPPPPPLVSVVSVDPSDGTAVVRMAIMSTFAFAYHYPDELYGALTMHGRTTRVTLTRLEEVSIIPARGWETANYSLPLPPGETGQAFLSFVGRESGFAFTVPAK